MAAVPVTLLTQDHDHYLPLALGDVSIPGVELRLRRVRVGTTQGLLERVYDDPAVDAGEASFARYISRVAAGDRSVVALPAFVVRSFRHRCIYVRRGDDLQASDLGGRTIGISEWRATGNTWTRAVLSDAGVRTQDCQWILARTDNAKKPPPRDTLPSNATFGAHDDTLIDLLGAGRIDAFIAPLEPKALYEADSPFVRLFDDFPSAERAYFQRTGIFPGHHIVCVKRSFFDAHPDLTWAIYRGLEESKRSCDENAKLFGQSSPWLLRDLETAQDLMGEDWRPYGMRNNRRMVDALCRELFEQGLVGRRVDASELFPEFEDAFPMQ
jgi:4,5-dihydroxyphthalate decarboxylase